MSRILAVETATHACSVAVAWDGERRELLRLARNQHAETLVPMVEQLLAEHQCALEQLDALAFGSGPGSFTGLRIGIAVAQGLAYGAGLPVVPVSSLGALASRVNGGRVLAAIDARMNQAYWNLYRRQADGTLQALGEPRVGNPRDLRLPDTDTWLAAGSGCEAYLEEFEPAVASRLDLVAGVHPHALEVARIAEMLLAAGQTIAPEQAAPEYVRNDVAQATAQRSGQDKP